MDYNDVISKVEAFDIETARESLNHSVGIKDTLEIAKIYDKYTDLFTPRMVTWAKKHLAKQAAPLDKRRATYLLDFLVDGVIGNKLKHLIDEESTYESSATVQFDGKDVPFRQVSTLVQNESVRARRKELVKRCKPVKKKLTSYEKKAIKTTYRLLKKFSGKDYVPYYAEHKNVDLDALGTMLRGFLVRTDALFTSLMEARLKTIKVSLKQAESHDYSVILRTKHYDTHFPKENLLSSLKTTLHGMGIDIDSQKNVHLDTEDRPKKVPRAFCSPIRIPDEIHLVLKPRGGQQDYQTILHEAGHTEHFAHTKNDLAYELKHMGGHAGSETYAVLFEYLTTSEAWLTDIAHLAPDVAHDFTHELLEQKMFMFRRYCAKLLYELKLHRNDLTRLDDRFEPIQGQSYKTMAACYNDILTKACKVNYPKDNWLLDVDSGFYSADYLRAWMLEAHLRSVLTKKFGTRWYASKDAGRFLMELWSTGANGRTMDELAMHIGLARLDTSAIEADFATLRGS